MGAGTAVACFRQLEVCEDAAKGGEVVDGGDQLHPAGAAWTAQDVQGRSCDASVRGAHFGPRAGGLVSRPRVACKVLGTARFFAYTRLGGTMTPPP